MNIFLYYIRNSKMMTNNFIIYNIKLQYFKLYSLLKFI